MANKLPLALGLLGISTVGGWVAACSSSNSSSPAVDSGASGSSSSSSGGGGNGSSGSAVHDSGISDAGADGSQLGLLVDNMTAKKGTQISLQVAAGDNPGSYYVYADHPEENATFMMSLIPSTAQLADTPVSPLVTNADGSQISGELCFGGQVVDYVGLGMNLVYAPPPADAAAGALSAPVPFDASHYSGVSFYINVSADAGGPMPSSIHFGVPDTQTADPAAWPTSACAVADAGACDDDFGADVTVTPGTWSKQSFKWSDLEQQTWGAQFAAIKQNQLIGMKWQANGAGVEASTLDSFNFCISDIYFTP
jgi:hypothetical protein